MALHGAFTQNMSCPNALAQWKSAVRLAPAHRSRGRSLVSAAYDPNRGYGGSNGSLLDAFFYGKAFAETLNEKLGTALDDALANFGKQDAERREAMREFQEEVEERARKEITQSRDSAGSISAGSVSTGSTAYASPTSMTMQGGRASTNGPPSSSPQGSGRAVPPLSSPSGSGRAIIATPPDLQETVDDLRAEMASTRASVKALQAKQQPSTL